MERNKLLSALSLLVHCRVTVGILCSTVHGCQTQEVVGLGIRALEFEAIGFC